MSGHKAETPVKAGSFGKEKTPTPKKGTSNMAATPVSGNKQKQATSSKSGHVVIVAQAKKATSGPSPKASASKRSATDLDDEFQFSRKSFPSRVAAEVHPSRSMFQALSDGEFGIMKRQLVREQFRRSDEHNKVPSAAPLAAVCTSESSVADSSKITSDAEGSSEDAKKMASFLRETGVFGDASPLTESSGMWSSDPSLQRSLKKPRLQRGEYTEEQDKLIWDLEAHLREILGPNNPQGLWTGIATKFYQYFKIHRTHVQIKDRARVLQRNAVDGQFRHVPEGKRKLTVAEALAMFDAKRNKH